MNTLNRQKVKGLRRRSRLRRILTFFSLIILTFITYSGYLFYQTYHAASESYVELDNRDNKSNLREKPVQISSDPVSIILLGIEDYASEYDRGRTDTIMVATFNPTDQTMKLLSIPRDTLVDIPGYKNKDKINHAFSKGDKELTIETVENFLDIPIDYFVSVKFEGFINIIDELGGVTVDVPFDFMDINRQWEKFYFTEGEMDLTGEAALVYARMRKKDPMGDFGRNERQRQIVKAVIDRLSSPSTILKIDDIATEIGKNVETNIKVREAIAFRQKYSNFNSSRIETVSIKGHDEYINDIYYFVPNTEEFEALKNELQAHLNHSNLVSQNN